MPPFIRMSLRIAAVFAVLFFLIQPFNWFCQISQSCRPFYLSRLIPKPHGNTPIVVDFAIQNYREGLEFKTMQKSITTVINKLNVVHYSAKNTSKRTISFRPVLYVEPKEFEEYIKRYNCFCFHTYKLKKGESIDLTMEFEINMGTNISSLLATKPIITYPTQSKETSAITTEASNIKIDPTAAGAQAASAISEKESFYDKKRVIIGYKIQ